MITVNPRFARICRAREDRAERARREANQALVTCRTALRTTEGKRIIAELRRHAAEATFAADPASEQALVWRAATGEALERIRLDECAAAEVVAQADRTLTVAREDHEKRAQQRSFLDERLAHERYLVREGRDDAEAEDRRGHSAFAFAEPSGAPAR